MQMRSYAAARSLYSFIGFLAWVAIIAGVVTALLGAGIVSEIRGFRGPPPAPLVLLGMVPGFILGFMGFLGLTGVQNGRATVDNAEYSQQMLQIARDQLAVSRQALKEGNPAPAQSFADKAAAETPDAPAASHAASKDAAPSSVPEKQISYRGKTIEKRDDKYLVGNHTFFSLHAAERQVDRMLA